MEGTQWLLAGCYEIFLFCCCVLHYLTALADHLEEGGREERKGERGGQSEKGRRGRRGERGGWEVGERGTAKEEQREKERGRKKRGRRGSRRVKIRGKGEDERREER